MSSKRFRFRNPRSKHNIIKTPQYKPEKQCIRENHRNPEFEIKEDLVEERYKLQCDIDQIRKENKQMKKEILELEEQYTMKEAAKIDYFEKLKTGENLNSAYHLKRLLNFSKQLDDLKVLQTELDSQYEFLDKFYSETNKDELAATTVFLTNQINSFSSELAEMENVITKANQRMEGPVETQKQLFFQQRKRIKLMKRIRNKLRIAQEEVEPCNYIKKVVIIPEELEAERDELKHKLQILQHRRYNRLKELEEMKRRRSIQKQEFTALVQHKQQMEKEVNERKNFCLRMKRNREQENQKKTNAVIINNEEEELWDPFTIAKEAHE